MLRALSIRPFALAFDDLIDAFALADRHLVFARYRRSPASRVVRTRARHALRSSQAAGL